MSLLSSFVTVTTTLSNATELFVCSIPPFLVNPPPLSPQSLIFRGCIWCTTGITATSLAARLRIGTGGIGGPLVGNSLIIPTLPSTNMAIPFYFIDLAGPGNLFASGYSICLQQLGATGNGSLLSCAWEVDFSVP
jgi:hypothetical protein